MNLIGNIDVARAEVAYRHERIGHGAARPRRSSRQHWHWTRHSGLPTYSRSSSRRHTRTVGQH